MSSSSSTATTRALDEAHAVMVEARNRYGSAMGGEIMRTMALMAMMRMSMQQEILKSAPVRDVGTKVPAPMLSLEHLPRSSNQTDEVYYGSPFGTYVLVKLDRSGFEYDPYQLHFMEGPWNQGAWLECDRSQIPVLAQGVTHADACSLILYDVSRRWRETPPVPERIEGASIDL